MAKGKGKWGRKRGESVGDCGVASELKMKNKIKIREQALWDDVWRLVADVFF